MPIRNPSKFKTSRKVDDPIVQDANYRFDAPERQYIDDQVRALQQWAVDEAIPDIEALKAGGGGSPGGASGEVQTNDGAGGFAGASNVAAGADYVSIGATPAGAGYLRFPYSGAATTKTVIGAKNSAAADVAFLTYGTGDAWTLGTSGQDLSVRGYNLMLSGAVLTQWGTSQWAVYNTSGSGYAMHLDASRLQVGIDIERPIGGRTCATIGAIRFPYNDGATADQLIAVKDSGGVDRNVLKYGGGDTFEWGHVGANCYINGSSIQLISQSSTFAMYWASTITGYSYTVGGYVFYSTGSTWGWGVPRHGYNTPYASEGRAAQAMADADQVLPASVYSRAIVQLTGALTVARTATFPHPASEDASYVKFIWNDCTGAQVTISTGTGGTISLAAGLKPVLFTPDGAQLAVL